MKVTCNVIQDLMPSYIDKVCTEDSCSIIEQHIVTCSACKQKLMELMSPEPFVEAIDKEEAQNPFKKIKRRNRIYVISAVILTAILLISSILIVQNVGVLHDFFYPQQLVTISSEYEEGWTRRYINESEYITFDSIFCKKEMVNNANSSGDLMFRISDKQGNIVVKETVLSPGESIKLDLENGQEYIIETKSSKGNYFLLFH